MMTESLVPDSSTDTLADILTRQMRALSGRTIAIQAAVGAAAIIGSLLWKPAAWHIFALAGACIVSMSVWAVADAELKTDVHLRRATRVALVIARTGAAICGTLAALALAARAITHIFGGWIS